jgi:hypothetical protein
MHQNRSIGHLQQQATGAGREIFQLGPRGRGGRKSSEQRHGGKAEAHRAPTITKMFHRNPPANKSNKKE